MPIILYLQFGIIAFAISIIFTEGIFGTNISIGDTFAARSTDGTTTVGIASTANVMVIGDIERTV